MLLNYICKNFFSGWIVKVKFLKIQKQTFLKQSPVRTGTDVLVERKSEENVGLNGTWTTTIWLSFTLVCHLSWSDSSEGACQMQVKFACCDKSGKNRSQKIVPYKSGLFKLVCNNNIIAQMAISNATIFTWKILPLPVDFQRLYSPSIKMGLIKYHPFVFGNTL